MVYPTGRSPRGGAAARGRPADIFMRLTPPRESTNCTRLAAPRPRLENLEALRNDSQWSRISGRSASLPESIAVYILPSTDPASPSTRLSHSIAPGEPSLQLLPANPSPQALQLFPESACLARGGLREKRMKPSKGVHLKRWECMVCGLSLIHISEPTRLRRISYAVFCLKKKKKTNTS